MPLSTLSWVAGGTPASNSAWPTRILRPVDVFDDRRRFGIAIIEVLDHDGYLVVVAEHCLGGPVAPLAGDDDVLTYIARRAHQNRLQDAVTADRFRQLLHLALVEELARVLPRPDARQARCFLHETS